jgi:hypothetical protein
MIPETPHPGSVDTLQALSSGHDALERYRIIHDFGQYVLNGVSGDMLEIGVGESSYYLSRLGEAFRRRIFHCDISPSKILNPLSVKGYLSDLEEVTYFEERDETPSLKRVVCFAGPSDDLFKRVPMGPIAFAFIDGDHCYEQAKKDFWNTWAILADEGVIALHDTYPPSEEWTSENKCGDVYRLRQELEARDDMDVFTLGRGCVIGVGITLVRKKRTAYPYA